MDDLCCSYWVDKKRACHAHFSALPLFLGVIFCVESMELPPPVLLILATPFQRHAPRHINVPRRVAVLGEQGLVQPIPRVLLNLCVHLPTGEAKHR